MAHPKAETDLQALALERLARVLGGPAAQRVYDEVLRTAGLRSVSTVEDLYAFAKVLSERPGFEGAVGGFLRVRAVLRGAART